MKDYLVQGRPAVLDECLAGGGKSRFVRRIVVASSVGIICHCFRKDAEIAAETRIPFQLRINGVDDTLHFISIAHERGCVYFLRMLVEQLPVFAGNDGSQCQSDGQHLQYLVFHLVYCFDYEHISRMSACSRV